ncbi:MAG: 30S ribosomal protein S5 [Patescibacteria group bacterium]
MSDDKIKLGREAKLETEKEADISSDIAEVTEVAKVVVPTESAPAATKGTSKFGGFTPKGRGPRPERVKEPSEFEEKMLAIDRVTRVVKGGRRMRFRALVVIGDKKGRIGFGVGKGNEVTAAAAKATSQAKKHLVHVPMAHGTLLHDVWGKSQGTQVLLKSAKKGRGLIAGGAVRTVLELAGYSDIVAKSFGSNNKINTVRAAMRALGAVIPDERLESRKKAKKDSVKKA